MTETGRVPGDGLPGNAGEEAVLRSPHTDTDLSAAEAGVEEQPMEPTGPGWGVPGAAGPAGAPLGAPTHEEAPVPPSPVYAFIDNSGDAEVIEEDDELLIMPGPQGTWGDPQPVPAQPPLSGAPVMPGTPRLPGPQAGFLPEPQAQPYPLSEQPQPYPPYPQPPQTGAAPEHPLAAATVPEPPTAPQAPRSVGAAGGMAEHDSGFIDVRAMPAPGEPGGSGESGGSGPWGGGLPGPAVAAGSVQGAASASGADAGTAVPVAHAPAAPASAVPAAAARRPLTAPQAPRPVGAAGMTGQESGFIDVGAVSAPGEPGGSGGSGPWAGGRPGPAVVAGSAEGAVSGPGAAGMTGQESGFIDVGAVPAPGEPGGSGGSGPWAGGRPGPAVVAGSAEGAVSGPGAAVGMTGQESGFIDVGAVPAPGEPGGSGGSGLRVGGRPGPAVVAGSAEGAAPVPGVAAATAVPGAPAQAVLASAVPAAAARRPLTAPQAPRPVGAAGMTGHDSGFIDVGAVPAPGGSGGSGLRVGGRPGPAVVAGSAEGAAPVPGVAAATAVPGAPAQAAPAPVAPAAAARRPLHMGPPIPEPPTGGLVRSLADRGPAPTAGPVPAPESASAPDAVHVPDAAAAPTPAAMPPAAPATSPEAVAPPGVDPAVPPRHPADDEPAEEPRAEALTVPAPEQSGAPLAGQPQPDPATASVTRAVFAVPPVEAAAQAGRLAGGTASAGGTAAAGATEEAAAAGEAPGRPGAHPRPGPTAGPSGTSEQMRPAGQSEPAGPSGPPGPSEPSRASEPSAGTAEPAVPPPPAAVPDDAQSAGSAAQPEPGPESEPAPAAVTVPGTPSGTGTGPWPAPRPGVRPRKAAEAAAGAAGADAEPAVAADGRPGAAVEAGAAVEQPEAASEGAAGAEGPEHAALNVAAGAEARPEGRPGPGAAPEAEAGSQAAAAPGAQAAAAPDAAAEPAPLPQLAADAAPPPAAEGYDDAVRDAVHRVIRERRDVRNGFRKDPIPHEVLIRVLEAAHTAPSVGHSQPWDFVVIRSAETRERMHALAMAQREAYAKSLPKGRAKQFRELKVEAILDTPVNIVVTADPTRGGRHTLGRYTQPQMAPYSSALAVENLWLAARAEGLGVGWVSFFDEREMVRELGLPEYLEVVAYLCVGYVDEFPEDPELVRAGWSRRRPLSWVVHEEAYGNRVLPGSDDPSDLLGETLRGIRPLDAKALGEAWERQKRMTKPAGALGMLEIISAQLSGLSRQCPPPIPEPAAVAIFAGDHGVHAQGVTAWPQEVTGQMVGNFLAGGAVCNAFANQVGAEVCVVDVGVAAELPTSPGLLPRKVRPGTDDFTAGPAMSRADAVRGIEVGIETARDLVAAGNRALLTGEMGVANTTVSAALIAVFTGTDPAEVTGRGTGVSDEMHARKIDVVRRALDLHRPDPGDPVGVLAALGGLEHAAMVGLLLGAASLRTPVILDGVSAGAAALVARAIAPEVLAACIAGHRSVEPGHLAALTKLGLRPLVDLDLRLGEGTGALLALPLVQSAARAMHEVATFDSAGVTEKH